MDAVMRRQVILYPDHEDGGWVAEVPSLPGCLSQGATKEAALENIRDAIEVWTEGARETGMVVPEDLFEVELHAVSAANV